TGPNLCATRRYSVTFPRASAIRTMVVTILLSTINSSWREASETFSNSDRRSTLSTSIFAFLFTGVASARSSGSLTDRGSSLISIATGGASGILVSKGFGVPITAGSIVVVTGSIGTAASSRSIGIAFSGVRALAFIAPTRVIEGSEGPPTAAGLEDTVE